MAVLAVGLRQETLPQRFLIATTASKVFQQPSNHFPSLCALRDLRVQNKISAD
jgi:hypothetical protein